MKEKILKYTPQVLCSWGKQLNAKEILLAN